MDAFIINAFSDELQKLGAVPVPAVEAASSLPQKLVKAHLPGMLVGASLLYGGQRAYQDVKMGEELRKQQRQQGF